MSSAVRRDIAIAGMDCADCARKIERALGRTPGVARAHVSLGAARATVEFDPTRTSLPALTRLIEALGYRVPGGEPRRTAMRARDVVSGAAVALVAVAVVAGMIAERLGVADAAARLVPWPLALAAVVVGGLPIFRNVVLALRARTVTPHALMTLGIAGALAIGEYGAAAVIVFFMRLADALDRHTAGRAREAIREIVALQPLEARVERGGREARVPAASVARGEVVLVKAGERIPVDGVVVAGQAAVNQAPVTGEATPVERGPGDPVLAASVALDGVLRVRAEHAGPDSTFGRIVRLVEEAEAGKSAVQRFADRVTAYYLPVVLLAAAGAWLAGGSPAAAVAVLVVSCSCGIALATPVAVLAAVGRAARDGILVKGGAALEALARADTLLLDKTGTLTVGQPEVVAVQPVGSRSPEEVLAAAASAERFSEHPLGRAIVASAGPLPLERAEQVEVVPGGGIAVGRRHAVVAVGAARFLERRGIVVPAEAQAQARALEAEGRTVVFVAEDQDVIGVVALADRPRDGVATALGALRALGVRRLVMLTGDSPQAAAPVAAALGLEYQAGLRPEDKIAVVRRLQAEGRIVAMIGDGINDAPALAQADVGIAMNAATGAALEAADVALLRNDWSLVPAAVRTSRRAFGVIRQNLFSAVAYNVAGLALAASGLLAPAAAAAAQVIPDLLILANSTRLLRPSRRAPAAG